MSDACPEDVSTFTEPPSGHGIVEPPPPLVDNADADKAFELAMLPTHICSMHSPVMGSQTSSVTMHSNASKTGSGITRRKERCMRYQYKR